jgi:hypothetical protein
MVRMDLAKHLFKNWSSGFASSFCKYSFSICPAADEMVLLRNRPVIASNTFVCIAICARAPTRVFGD